MKAMFFDLKEGLASTEFDFSLVGRRCVPHPDGRPKHSSIGDLPCAGAIAARPGSLWLVTVRGQVLS